MLNTITNFLSNYFFTLSFVFGLKCYSISVRCVCWKLSFKLSGGQNYVNRSTTSLLKTREKKNFFVIFRSCVLVWISYSYQKVAVWSIVWEQQSPSTKKRVSSHIYNIAPVTSFFLSVTIKGKLLCTRYLFTFKQLFFLAVLLNWFFFLIPYATTLLLPVYQKNHFACSF